MDSCVAVVHLLAVVKEGLYVRLLRRLHFNYRRQGLPHNTANTAALAAHRCATGRPQMLLHRLMLHR
jgi:hypothetical protein